ncbi:hypothetical protein SAMN06265375_10346 [Muriicola jejuensis]|uniref:Probable inorganic carbon transporter subunit DabA n=1 Tax=Muriicola jejuensis TaxID=504488 RepID=A0A6P0UI96_9FLAO|nr:DUF2309 domain-containing protein [Muriicola jejuensis]NER11588.1 DUF2309 family protein [Muriicola jejuensis]SMP19504.1 hypothetical protein SAMN06265375_10346 [Muriicola jejuensis]
MSQKSIKRSVEEAAAIIGKTWPLYSFVTSNPLTGLEKMSFREAIQSAEELLQARVLPDVSMLRQAWEAREIGEEELLQLLAEGGYDKSPEYYLQLMASVKEEEKLNEVGELDRITVKWLTAFMDEGLAEWDIPGKEQGFYGAWRTLVNYDGEVGKIEKRALPKSASEALEYALTGVEEDAYTRIFQYHFGALPGWVGYIKHRTETNSSWQQAYPISLEDYLAVRLVLARQLELPLLPSENQIGSNAEVTELGLIWLRAWEKSWQHKMVHELVSKKDSVGHSDMRKDTPDAQLVFCIDTRSELIRRHVESKGKYETFGYAGFFGIAMDYEDLNDGLSRKSCPPILNSAYQVTESPQADKGKEKKDWERKNAVLNFWAYFLKRMKNMLPSTFGFVEGSGIFYGFYMLGRTLAPSYVKRNKFNEQESYEGFCEPEIHQHHDCETGISLNEKVGIVKSAFDLLGWRKFAPLVLFAGHGSHTANNPYGSSLDCGACAASPGRHNARMLAKLANLPEVREVLSREHHIEIPKNTVFIGAEHNTTTDEIVVFDADVPESHRDALRRLKTDLQKARETATLDRLGVFKGGITKADTNATHWAETRPEWGLAKNAGFVVGPRHLTADSNLGGRCFLHSYDWKLDPTGAALEGIMQGPMVVTQWINNHYYFSTVDNEKFGGGSKITHNITGRYGVVQGNGGDLKMGLPLQSVKQTDDEMYHQPLRLSVLIQAPESRVEEILNRNDHLKTLLENEWIYLLVMDPTQSNQVRRYGAKMQWQAMQAQDTMVNKNRDKKDRRVYEEITT